MHGQSEAYLLDENVLVMERGHTAHSRRCWRTFSAFLLLGHG